MNKEYIYSYEELLDLVIKYQKENAQLKERIDKTIEYIKDTPKIIKSMYFDKKNKDDLPTILVFLERTFKENLLEILKGDNNE